MSEFSSLLDTTCGVCGYGYFATPHGDGETHELDTREKHTFVTARQRIAELESEAAALRAVVRQVEWTETASDQCPWCRADQVLGEDHEDNCSRQAALSGDAGKRLLEAVRDFTADDACKTCGYSYLDSVHDDLGESYHEYRGRHDEAVQTLRELGVLEAL